jgi:hypothetical protein
MKNGKVRKIYINRSILPYIWDKTVRTIWAKWGCSSVTKGTFGLWFGLFLEHLTFFSKVV